MIWTIATLINIILWLHNCYTFKRDAGYILKKGILIGIIGAIIFGPIALLGYLIIKGYDLIDYAST